jgi:hypothetical protein
VPRRLISSEISAPDRQFRESVPSKIDIECALERAPNAGRVPNGGFDCAVAARFMIPSMGSMRCGWNIVRRKC